MTFHLLQKDQRAKFHVVRMLPFHLRAAQRPENIFSCNLLPVIDTAEDGGDRRSRDLDTKTALRLFFYFGLKINVRSLLLVWT